MDFGWRWRRFAAPRRPGDQTVCRRSNCMQAIKLYAGDQTVCLTIAHLPCGAGPGRSSRSATFSGRRERDGHAAGTVAFQPLCRLARPVYRSDVACGMGREMPWATFARLSRCRSDIRLGRFWLILFILHVSQIGCLPGLAKSAWGRVSTEDWRHYRGGCAYPCGCSDFIPVAHNSREGSRISVVGGRAEAFRFRLVSPISKIRKFR